MTPTARICVLDYGMGNLRSVEKALERVGASAVVTSDVEVARGADGLVLPGVGAFPRAMSRIRELGFDALLRDHVAADRPVLGICLGAQLVLESSTELGGAEGLGLVPGEVTRLEAPGLKLPHIGWEPVRWESESELVEGIPDGTPFYFVHAYAPRPARSADVLGTAVHGERFACALVRAPVYGAQFHPEKSSAAGLKVLANFNRICARASDREPAGSGHATKRSGGPAR
ncbi:MAG TPA: imidazole glycerol phosphate synthase subunit HisH [Solirubrobacterales bacterium]|nr:imidazole glycerol phosphate synthase subunit HisH [Solirubrobacterales bacterium]